MSGMLGMLPGIGKVKKQIDAANLDDRVLKRQRAIISSMTPKERRNPKILDGKRKRRIAAGSGTKPEDINKLHQDAPPDGGHDEDDGQARRAHAAHDGRRRRRARARPRWSACRRSSGGSIRRRWRPAEGAEGALPKGLPGMAAGPAGRCRGCPVCLGSRAAAHRDSPGLPGLPGKKK